MVFIVNNYIGLSGFMTQELQETIIEFQALFTMAGDKPWLEHVEKTLEIIELDEVQGLDFVRRSYFGGSGTLSDLNISSGNDHTWPNNDFDEANRELEKIGDKLYDIVFIQNKISTTDTTNLLNKVLSLFRTSH